MYFTIGDNFNLFSIWIYQIHWVASTIGVWRYIV